jgi:outer membrane beta-barrel protein
MNNKIVTLLAVVATLIAIAAPAFAQQPDVPRPADPGQVIVPQVERREVRVPKFPSNDFSVGAFVGTYATQNFGTSAVAGLRVAYHISEDVFVEGTLAQTKVSDEDFTLVLPGGVIPENAKTLRYYSLSAGYNILPGEVFVGRNRALASQLFLVGGVGSTSFADQKRQTFNFGFGAKVFLTDRAVVRLDLRDHVFSLDLLGKRRSTQNLELGAGFDYHF